MMIVSPNDLGFNEPIQGIILGAHGGVGEALAHHILAQAKPNRLVLTYRSQAIEAFVDHPSVHQYKLDITNESAWQSFTQALAINQQKFNLVFNATGLLSRTGNAQNSKVQPERALRDLSFEQMTEVFAVNTFGLGLALKYLCPLLNRRERSIFASLSAKVGSIADNRIGGWYSYRASKAAQNMLLKTAAIELARSHKNCICVGLHPGTVYSDLSAPFTARVKHTIFTSNESAQHLTKVLQKLNSEDSGHLYSWDGSQIPF